ncbi:MAG: RlmE family RNA methyltransferase [Pseudomonadota bacterium]|nr:RlmE family RNA methyltransferase [Pseudomonadota bacterium]
MSEERRRLVRPPSGGDPAGRGTGEKLKTARDRKPSSQHWLKRQIEDPYAQAARAQGWRSRAAFKLLEMDDRFHFLRRGARVVDLGCAPGGWIQAALERGAGAVVGVDLLPVDPLPPAHLIQGDFTDPAIGPALLERLGGPPDVILSDMAPNTVGHRETDHLRILNLIELAADFAGAHLKPGGAFVTKSFQGGGSAELMASLKPRFHEVRHVKPKSSRTESSEVYLVALGRR